MRLGTYPQVSLATARRLAAEAKASPAIHSGGLRTRELWEMYRTEVGPTRRSFGDVEMVWNRWADPLVGSVRVEDLSMRHGAELIAKVSRHSSANRARKVIRYINPMLKFAVGRGLISGNPWAGLHVPEGVEPRDRVLSREEWCRLWAWGQGEPYPHGPFLRVLMLSAQRLGEVAGMTWDEIDGDLWTIPPARHKGKRRHEVVFPPMLAELVASLPRHDHFVFSTRPGQAIRPGSRLRDRIERDTGVTGWRFHDIRRTGATLMAEGGVARFIVERVLGHSDRSVTAVYDRHSYREEKRAALAAIAASCGPPAGTSKM